MLLKKVLQKRGCGAGGWGTGCPQSPLEGCAKSRPGRTDSTLGVPEPVQGLRGSREGPGKASEAHFGSLFEAPGLQLGPVLALPNGTWSRCWNLEAFEALQHRYFVSIGRVTWSRFWNRGIFEVLREKFREQRSYGDNWFQTVAHNC